MDLDHRDLRSFLVGELVEREQPWLVRLDEIDEARDSRLLLSELSWLESVGGDEDERSRHGVSFSRSDRQAEGPGDLPADPR